MKDNKSKPGTGAGSNTASCSSFELRPLNYYRHPIFDHTGAEDVNHNLNAPSSRRSASPRTRRQPPTAVDDGDAGGASQVYIRCPGRPMPFRVLVVVAGLIQIDVAVFALYFWLTHHPAYKYFPQWGPLLLDGEESVVGGYAPCVWFAIEILLGLWLVSNVVLKASRPLFTLWLWTVLALTMTSLVHFCWSIPFKYEQYGYDVLGKFAIQFLFHLLLVGVGREHFKQQYANSYVAVVQATV